jgi:hypothetical protein
MFVHWQKSGGEEAWQTALAAGRDTLIATEQPRFVTVLAVSLMITGATTPAEIAQARYSGPLYFDFDGVDLDTVIPKFKQFLDKLQDMGIDLRSLQLSATGGRGFHVLIPPAVFMPKVPKNGTLFLPAIYKEMAFELFVDTMDMRVYSARRGRMFRVENSLRENGAYKVPLTVEEALNITPENYKSLCSAPRQPPALTPPQLNQKLAVLFAQAEQKVTAASKRKKDSSKDKELLARFKGQYPPTLARIMAGEGTAEDVGFHQIAMQIAITSNALGKKEEAMLEACAGLIENHVSDGSRYNTPAKRRAELSRMYAYTNDNVCYTYSKDAVRRVAPAGASTVDLDGVPGEAGAVLGDTGDDQDGYLSGVFLTEGGLYRKAENGAQKICPLAFRDVIAMTDPQTGKVLGFDAELLKDGKAIKESGVPTRVLLDNTLFQSRSMFQKFAGEYNGGITGTDNHVVALQNILGRMAMQNNGVTYIVSREGLDLIQRPDTDEDVLDMVWVTPDQPVITESTVSYKHRGNPDKGGMYKSDLMSAPDMVADEDSAKVIEALLTVNEPGVVGNILGWMVSSVHRQIYHHIYGQFPLLHLFGQAGAGKTKTIECFLFMHYHRARPLMTDAIQATGWSVAAAMQSSASIPCVIDEYKPRDMKAGRHNYYRSQFRAAYTGATYGKGGMATELGSSWKDIRTLAYCAPTVILAEGLESETAVVERSVIVPMKKAGITGRAKAHTLLRDKRTVLSSLGKDIVRATFQLNMPQFRQRVDSNIELCSAAARDKDSHRPFFNQAVVLTGLDFLDDLLAVRFGSDRFKPQMEVLRQAVKDSAQHVAVTPMPEAAKVMNTLALMSNTEEAMSEFGLRYGFDYMEMEPGTIDLKMRNIYVKYAGWSRRKGVPVFYDTESAFIHGLGNYNACINRACLDNKDLKPEGTEVVYRFSLEELSQDGVDRFRATERKKKV